jgi:hypothetical protein
MPTGEHGFVGNPSHEGHFIIIIIPNYTNRLCSFDKNPFTLDEVVEVLPGIRNHGIMDNGVSCPWARNKDANLFLIIVRSGFEILFAGANLGIQTIFFWREDADELVIVCAGWKIGHVEV